MAKILIAGIGGGQKQNGTYRKANYEIEGKKYEGRTFITSALEEHYGIDKTIYIGTTGSMWDNLYEHYCNKYGIEYKEEYAFQLLEVIEKSKEDYTIGIDQLDLSYFNEIFKGHVEGRVTQYGINEGQIFENFNIIMDLNSILEDGDEVYLDITHSFRSNAMWMFLVMNYINDVVDKDIIIKGITYGMLEISGANGGIVPVIDLNAFYKLLKWIKGANDFKNYGNSYMLLDIVGNLEVKKKLQRFSDTLNINNISSLKESVRLLKGIQNKIAELNGPGKLLIPVVVSEFLKEFNENDEDYIFQMKLAKWHLKHKRFGLSYININESLLGYVEKELMSLVPNYPIDNNKRYNPHPRAKEFLDKLAQKIANDINIKKFEKDLIKLLELYLGTRKIRNMAAHSIDDCDTALNDVRDLDLKYQKLEFFIKKKKNFIFNKEQQFGFLKNKWKRR